MLSERINLIKIKKGVKVMERLLQFTEAHQVYQKSLWGVPGQKGGVLLRIMGKTRVGSAGILQKKATS